MLDNCEVQQGSDNPGVRQPTSCFATRVRCGKDQTTLDLSGKGQTTLGQTPRALPGKGQITLGQTARAARKGSDNLPWGRQPTRCQDRVRQPWIRQPTRCQYTDQSGAARVRQRTSCQARVRQSWARQPASKGQITVG